jgi:hypothetical protein
MEAWGSTVGQEEVKLRQAMGLSTVEELTHYTGRG